MLPYLAGGISDHSPLSLTLCLFFWEGEGGWRLSPGWLQNEQVEARLREAIASYWPTNEDTADPPVVWDSFKAVVSAFRLSRLKEWRTMLKFLGCSKRNRTVRRDIPGVLLMPLMHP